MKARRRAGGATRRPAANGFGKEERGMYDMMLPVTMEELEEAGRARFPEGREIMERLARHHRARADEIFFGPINLPSCRSVRFVQDGIIGTTVDVHDDIRTADTIDLDWPDRGPGMLHTAALLVLGIAIGFVVGWLL